MVLITRWQPEWRFLSQCDHKSQSQNCYYTIHDHLFNTNKFWATVRVLTCPRTMHRKHLNEKSFGPFRPVKARGPGSPGPARPGPWAARPVTISSTYVYRKMSYIVYRIPYIVYIDTYTMIKEKYTIHKRYCIFSNNNVSD